MIKLDTCFIFFAYIRHHLCTFPSNAQYFHSQEVVVVYKTTYFFPGLRSAAPLPQRHPGRKKRVIFHMSQGRIPGQPTPRKRLGKKKAAQSSHKLKGTHHGDVVTHGCCCWLQWFQVGRFCAYLESKFQLDMPSVVAFQWIMKRVKKFQKKHHVFCFEYGKIPQFWKRCPVKNI